MVKESVFQGMTRAPIHFLPLPEVNFPLCLAPMVGLSHVALREVCRSYLPAGARTLLWTEMLNSRRLPGENFRTTPEVMRGPEESGLVPQILGNEEKHIAPSVQKLIEWGAVAIDINMGCPVQKALRHNYGVALMGDPAYAAEVVKITKRNSTVPVSVKLRAGEQNDFEYLLRFVSGLIEAGADWICLHPRTAAQQRRGAADWSQVRELKQRLGTPLIGNGDIQTETDVFQMLEQTSCDLVMAGRALAARPWLLWQVGETMGFGPPPGRGAERAPRTRLEEGQEYGRSLRELLRISKLYFGEDLAMRKFRFHVRTTEVWLLFGQALVSVVNKAKTVEEIESALVQFFAQDIEMLPRTDLRQ
jgi:tRNA-dihydrouridine synthase